MVGLIDLPSAGSIIIGGTDVYEGVNLSDAEIDNNRWASSGNDKKKKKRTVLPAKLDKRITGLRRSHIGFIFQTFNLIPVLNVYENINFRFYWNQKTKIQKVCRFIYKAQKEEWIDYLDRKSWIPTENNKATELSEVAPACCNWHVLL